MDFMLQCMTPLHSHQSARRGPDPRLFSIRSRANDNVIPAAGRGPGGRAGTGDCMAAGNGYAPLRSFVLIGTACSFVMGTVSCLTRFFPTRPAALARRSGVSKGLALSPVATTGTAAMLAGSSLPWGYPGAPPGRACVIGGGLALLQPAARPGAGTTGLIDGAARRIASTGIRNKRTAIFRSAAAGHRAGRPRPATAVPERGIMADSPP
ncbi:MAG: hypothetical protein LCH68_12205 [Proteobacteria bacterium]|nr:hypothetical protein [Pseudomonadota bacterium]